MFGLHRGIFTLSLDFELIWGSRDLVDDPSRLLRDSRITRDEVFPPLLELFTHLGLNATWATVGNLFLESAAAAPPAGGGPARLHPDLPRPQHAWVRGDWLDGVPAGSEATHPEWYGRSLVEALVAAGQEVGSHSFTHPIFGDPGCSREVAEAELAHAVAAAAELGLTLRSFVFPRNVPGHVDLLAQHGFTCWRPPEPQGPLTRRLPRQAQRAAHLARVALGRPGPTVQPSRDEHGLWCIPGSAVLLPVDGVRRAIPVRQRVVRATGGIDHAAARREVFHLYLHPINLAGAPGPLLDGMRAIIEHAARLRDRGQLDMLSMGELAARLEASHASSVKSPA